jgi:hypothetical protein
MSGTRPDCHSHCLAPVGYHHALCGARLDVTLRNAGTNSESDDEPYGSDLWSPEEDPNNYGPEDIQESS